MIQPDWPVLADGEVRHVGEAVALVAAEDRGRRWQAALAAIAVEYEPLPPLLDMEEALARGRGHRPLEGPPRRGRRSPWRALGRGGGGGDVPHALPGARLHRDQRDDRRARRPGRVVVYGSMQCPFYVQKAVASALGCDLSQARIVQTVTGGGFGGKEDAPSAPGAQVALLARATGRPVRLILSREEDMAVMSKRHPRPHPHAHGRHRATAASSAARWTTCSTAAPTRRSRRWCSSAARCTPAAPTACPTCSVDARAVRTHTVPCGAFRGFGEPQVVFACESQMDLLAERLGMDPLELRRRNALRRRGRDDHRPPPHRERRASARCWTRSRRRRTGRSKRDGLRAPTRDRCAAGIGLAACYYGVGLGAMGKHLNPAGANVVVAADGSVTVAVGTTEIGQGMITVLSPDRGRGAGLPGRAR